MPDDLVNKWKSLSAPCDVHVISFYSNKMSNKYASFSNFYRHRPIPFVIPCGSKAGEIVEVEFSEKSIMLCKASLFNDNFAFEAIRNATSPANCKKLGRTVQGFDDKKWHEHICAIAYAVILSKFSQIPDIKVTLLKTGDNLIAETAPNDAIWGIGLPPDSQDVQEPSRWRGMNILGWALMSVRNSLVEENASH